MRTELNIGLVVAAVVACAGCTVSQTADQALTGPSTFATSVTVTADPDIISLGRSATTLGDRAQIIVNVFDATGQPKPNQTIRLDTVVNGQSSSCGQLSAQSLTSGSDGRALAFFTAPSTPPPPSCPNFSTDGTVTVRATPVGSRASTAAASAVDILMVLPSSSSSAGSFNASFAISTIAGTRNFLFYGSS